MKPTCSLLCFCLVLGLAPDALAKQKRGPGEPAEAARSPDHGRAPEGPQPAPEPKAAAPGATLDFDFFSQEPGAKAGVSGTSGGDRLQLDNPDRAAQKAKTRRWMLTTHQTLGIATWALMAATVVVGQLHYNELYGGGSGSLTYRTPHRWLVVSTSAAFATTAAFSLFAPSPYEKPLRFDTGLLHRIAVIGATAGMLTQAALGWVTARRAEAGNPNNLRTYARTHQILGYTTLGFLTVAGVVWVF